MAAGLGFKTFNSGDVLSAADVNGYLMQGVLVFASTAARDAAITAPAEGQFAFTKDTNSLFYYDGAAWVASGATGDIEGVTAGTGISGGGTSGTVTITNSMATAIDAKGDLIGGTGADTFARLAVGANDTVLTADSTAATGLKWATPAGGGGMTLLSTTALSGTSTSVAISASGYIGLFITVTDFNQSTGGQNFFRLNSDSTANIYRWVGIHKDGTNTATLYSDVQNAVYQSFNADPTQTNSFWNIQIFNSQQTESFKGGHAFTFQERNADARKDIEGYDFSYASTSAITNFTYHSGAGTFSAGEIKVYGVK